MKGRICLIIIPQILLSIIATVLVSNFDPQNLDRDALKSLVEQWELSPIVEVMSISLNQTEPPEEEPEEPPVDLEEPPVDSDEKPVEPPGEGGRRLAGVGCPGGYEQVVGWFEGTQRLCAARSGKQTVFQVGECDNSRIRTQSAREVAGVERAQLGVFQNSIGCVKRQKVDEQGNKYNYFSVLEGYLKAQQQDCASESTCQLLQGPLCLTNQQQCPLKLLVAEARTEPIADVYFGVHPRCLSPDKHEFQIDSLLSDKSDVAKILRNPRQCRFKTRGVGLSQTAIQVPSDYTLLQAFQENGVVATLTSLSTLNNLRFDLQETAKIPFNQYFQPYESWSLSCSGSTSIHAFKNFVHDSQSLLS